MDKGQAILLLERYCEGNCTPQEKRWVELWLNRLEESGDVELTADELQKVQLRIQSRLLNTIVAPAKLRPLWQRSWLRWSAAAAILIAITGYFLFVGQQKKTSPGITIQEKQQDIKAPEHVTAYITLADGTKVTIDSLSEGIAKLGNGLQLNKSGESHIAYTNPQGIVSYNTLSVPRGSKPVTLMLPDETQVWIDAGSSVTYPTAFSGTERKVTLTGQAYFEVAPLSPKGGQGRMPFIVAINSISGEHKADVEVLGTHFNINAYDDEEMIRTTLIEGKVKVSSIVDPQSAILKPGEQAQLTTNYPEGTPRSKLQTTNKVDVEEVLAWKNGKFIFGSKAGIEAIMRQIARWYDVEVMYEGGVPQQQFGGEIPRSASLLQVLEILKSSGVKFTLDKRRVNIQK